MATYFFKGKAFWSKVDTPVPNYSKDGYQYEISLVMDEESERLFKESGLTLRPSKNEGAIRFKRPTSKLIKGELRKYDSPEVIGPDDKPFTGKIGNESTVIVKVDVYPTRMGVGHQLEAVKILDLIPYGEETEVVSPPSVVPF